MAADTALTAEILRREVFHRLAEGFPTPWDVAQTAIVTLHQHPEVSHSSLRVQWRGAAVLRLFENEKLDGSLDAFSHDVITSIVDSLRRQLNREPATEDR